MLVPQIKLVEVNVPQIRVPKIKVLRISIPWVKMPQVNLPQVNLPQINVAHINIPGYNGKPPIIIGNIWPAATNLFWRIVQKHPGYSISTHFYYGIFTTQESFRFGHRKLVTKEHTEMLARKVTAHVLPQELVDVVAEALLALVKQDVLAKVERGNVLDPDWTDIHTIPSRTPAEKTVLKRITTLTGRTVLKRSRTGTQNSRPEDMKLLCLHQLQTTPWPDVGLSIGKDAVHQSLNTPPYRVVKEYYETSDAKIKTIGEPPTPGIHTGMDTLYYQPRRWRIKRCLGLVKKTQLEPVVRCLQWSDIEEAVTGWNAEHAKALVEMMELELLSVSEGRDPLRPSFVATQCVWSGT